MKNESGSCAHLKVVHKRNQHEGGYWDSWECDLCGVRFSPVHPIDPPQGLVVEFHDKVERWAAQLQAGGRHKRKMDLEKVTGEL